MSVSICGLDCSDCGFKTSCKGCAETGGRPFGGDCIVAKCVLGGDCKREGRCCDGPCGLKSRLIAEFNSLGIEDMEEITSLNALVGSYINLEYTLPGGQKLKFWDDGRIYLGNQVRKNNSDRYYGVTADENYLLVCEYGENGSDAEIVLFRRREK